MFGSHAASLQAVATFLRKLVQLALILVHLELVLFWWFDVNLNIVCIGVSESWALTLPHGVLSSHISFLSDIALSD